MFENLSAKLQGVFGGLKSKGRLTEADIDAAMKEIRMALLEADVNFKVVKGFIKRTKERCLAAEVMESLTPAQNVVKIVNDELTELMGSTHQRINLSSRIPTVLLMCGLQGSGKTTHSAKLAYLFRQQGKRPLLVACDIYRPAAIEQLKVVGEKAGVPVFEMGQTDPVKIVKKALAHAHDYGNDIVIIDTAGRLHNKVGLMNELAKMKRVVGKVVEGAPHEVLLVLDGSTGQNAFEQARQFAEATEITALAVTKLDGTAKGGVVIGISHELKVPVKYIGIGEKVTDLQLFDSTAFVSAIFDEKI